MSRASVSTVEAAYEALARDGLDAHARYWADDIEWQATGGSWRGRAAGRRYLQAWFDLFDDFTTETLEIVDAGSDQVAVWIRYSGRVKGSGMEPPPEYFAALIEVRDGKLARAREYATLDEALEAAAAGH
jgi:ketosteroid isomerase-like protein